MAKKSLNNIDMLETTESFEEAYKAHSGSIYKFLFWRTKDKQISEDLTSATFQKAWISRSSFKGGSSKAWLYTIARNTLYDYWRKSKELSSDELEETLVDDRISVSDDIDKEIELNKLKKAVSKLPKEMKEVVNLRFIEGLSSKEVAKRLNMSDGNVRIIQYRALKKLKEYLA